jgi:hypothetical protein
MRAIYIGRSCIKGVEKAKKEWYKKEWYNRAKPRVKKW